MTKKDMIAFVNEANKILSMDYKDFLKYRYEYMPIEYPTDYYSTFESQKRMACGYLQRILALSDSCDKIVPDGS